MFEWCMDGFESENGHQKDVYKRRLDYVARAHNLFWNLHARVNIIGGGGTYMIT